MTVLPWDDDPLEALHRRLSALVPGPTTPGAVALIAGAEGVVFHRAYGWAQTHDEAGALPRPRQMTTGTLVDVASITKLFTTAAVMRLEQAGEIDLSTPVAAFLPALAADPRLTLDALLTHRAGLAAWQPVYLYTRDRAEAIEWVCRHGTRRPPGSARRYSDLGFMMLGAVVERVTGQRLDRFCDRELFAPHGMTSTCFVPGPERREDVAATSTGNRTEQRMIDDGDPEPVDAAASDYPGWRTHTLVGEVQDGNAAYAFAGVAGSAGAFSTAADLAVFGMAMAEALAGMTGRWRRSTVETFLQEPLDAGQGRGWWTRRDEWGQGRVAFGHGGFTGCEIAVVPGVQAVAVLLTNRLHTERDPPPDHAGLWRLVLAAARAALATCPRP